MSEDGDAPVVAGSASPPSPAGSHAEADLETHYTASMATLVRQIAARDTQLAEHEVRTMELDRKVQQQSAQIVSLQKVFVSLSLSLPLSLSLSLSLFSVAIAPVPKTAQ